MADSIIYIATGALKPHPRNEEFYNNIEGDDYNRLRDSIAVDGIMQPLRVAPDMTIISGHQRVRACKELGIAQVPVMIVKGLIDEDDKLRQLIASNFGRMKNDPIRQSKWLKEYERLKGVRQGSAYKKADPNNSGQLTQEDIAKELNVSVDTLRNLKQLDKLLPELQDIISEGRITATTGFKVIARLSRDEQEQLLATLPATESFTQKQIQVYIDRIKGLEERLEQVRTERDELEVEAVEAQRILNESAEPEE